MLRFKVIGEVEHFGGMHLAEFEAMLAAKFGGEVRHINNIGVKDGCIELFFQVHQTFMYKVVKGAVEDAEWFINNNIMLVQAMGENAIHLQEPENAQTGMAKEH